MCTRFTVPYKVGKDTKYLVARTMDFARMTGGHYVEFGIASDQAKYYDYSDATFKKNVYRICGRATVIKVPELKIEKDVLCDASNKYFSVETLWLPETTYARSSTVPQGTPMNKRFDALTLTNFILSGRIQKLDDLADTLRDGYAIFEESDVEKYITGHLAITEWSSGRTLVVEIGTGANKNKDDKNDFPNKGRIRVYSPTVTGYGVMTNSPTYDQQWGNLRGYVNLVNPFNTDKVDVGGLKDVPLTGNGNNLVGLPGGPLPADRFVRTNILLTLGLNKMGGAAKDFNAAKKLAAEILGTVFVTDGVSAEKGATIVTPDKWDQTLWMVLKGCEGDQPFYWARDDSSQAFTLQTV